MAPILPAHAPAPGGHAPGMPRPSNPCVAAGAAATDDDGIRVPAGEVHAWEPGTNQTLCGIPLARAQLQRFSHVRWLDAQPATGGHADYVTHVCPRCAAATGHRQGEKRWTRTAPRP